MTRSARARLSRRDQSEFIIKSECMEEINASLNPCASAWDSTSHPNTGTVQWDNAVTNEIARRNVPVWNSKQKYLEEKSEESGTTVAPNQTTHEGSKSVSSPGTTSSSELDMNVPLHSWNVPPPQPTMWSTQKFTPVHGTTPSARQFSKCEQEEEREEEALPSYLSYLQPNPSFSLNVHSFQQADQSFEVSGPNVSNVPNQLSQPADASRNLTDALRSFIASTFDGYNSVPPHPITQDVLHTKSSCCSHCANLTQTVHCLQKTLHHVSQELEYLQSLIPSFSQYSRKPSFLDRISTLEGRQSSFQSQLAQLFQLFGFTMGKDIKKQSIKLHKSVQDAISELPVIQSQHSHLHSDSTPTVHSTESILSALSREHEASLTRMSHFLEGKITHEGTQRVSLESRVQVRLSELEEWLQQLEAESSSRHDPLTGLSSQLTQLQMQITQIDRQKKVKSEFPQSLKRLQTQFEGNSSQWNSKIKLLEEEIALLVTQNSDFRNELKCQLETFEQKLMHSSGTESLVRQCVSVIAHQVACITREYMNVCMEEYHTAVHEALQKYVTKYKEDEYMLPRRWRRHINATEQCVVAQ
ncbi:unnamed protein product [Albugo candida]|uniref:Uncharacterized protein n=1 Tax=Albugo candida TaxID=65357 RepID=A0A024FV22_9STRA|nr:unnamed protein product [Albugo candida]|eukprot:CCI10901.1 unnamed protein product [Albugo candida]